MNAAPDSGEAVRHVPERRRYEIHRDGLRVGLADYLDSGDVAVITHTETSPHLQGQGLAGRLTQAMLDDLRARGLRVVPSCPFTAAWIRDHPDYADLLARERT